MRKKNGFTLVELLSTVVILGVVLSVTVYIVMKNINKSKEDAELITYNNIKNAAKVYNDEVASYWNTKDNYEYSCISLGDMIENGFFDEDTINKNDKLSKETKIKVVRDKDSKVIKETSFSFEDSILPDVDCGYQSSVSIYNDETMDKNKSAKVKILYSVLNNEYYKYIYLSNFREDTVTTNDVVYSCEGIGNCSESTVSNLESGHWYLTNSDVVRLSIKSNGTISAFVNFNGENVAEATKDTNVNFDSTPPVCTLSADASKITATASDNEGIAYQGWDSSYSGTNETTKSISAGEHIYYVKDTSDNTNMCSIMIASTAKETESYQNCFAANKKYTVDGTCSCRQIKGVNGGHSIYWSSCTSSGGCSCSSGYETWSNNCSKSFSGYQCNNGGVLSGSQCCKTEYKTTYNCPSGYTKINNSWCYK